MEGSSRQERYCLRSFEEDPTDHGYMIRHRDEPLSIERTPDNDHFFLWSNEGRFELNYTGSAEIVHLLDVHLLTDARLKEEGKPPRPISFYDVSGNFHPSLIVHDLAAVSGKGFGPKHVAVFQPAEAGETPFAIPIDDIYCLGLPRSDHEGSLMTDYESPAEPAEENL